MKYQMTGAVRWYTRLTDVLRQFQVKFPSLWAKREPKIARSVDVCVWTLLICCNRKYFRISSETIPREADIGCIITLSFVEMWPRLRLWLLMSFPFVVISIRLASDSMRCNVEAEDCSQRSLWMNLFFLSFSPSSFSSLSTFLISFYSLFSVPLIFVAI